MSVCVRRRLTLAQTQHVHVGGRGRDGVDLGPHGEGAAAAVPEVRAWGAGHCFQCGWVAARGGGHGEEAPFIRSYFLAGGVDAAMVWARTRSGEVRGCGDSERGDGECRGGQRWAEGSTGKKFLVTRS